MDAEIERGSLSPTGVNQSILGTGVTESSDTGLNSIILVANYTPSGRKNNNKVEKSHKSACVCLML